MRTIIQITHVSLDGFVSDDKGELDLFENANEHLGFVNTLLSQADSVMSGRITYEMFKNYWPDIEHDEACSADDREYSRWYNDSTKFVISTTLKEAGERNTTLIKQDVLATIEKIKNSNGKDILVFGSPSIGQLLSQANLIDEYWIFINPVIFGTGVPMFASDSEVKRLALIECRAISNGEVALHYQIRK